MPTGTPDIYIVKIECPTHGCYDSKVTEVMGSVFKTGCPGCIKEREATEKLQKEIAKREAERERMARSNIEPHFYDATLESYKAIAQEQVKALEAIKKLIAGEIKKLVMIGSNGTGKTHLAIAAVKVLGGVIKTMYEITTEIRSSYTAMAKKTELEIVDELARVPLLVIDEIGRTKGSDAEANWLSYIIDKRHVRGLPIILISNKHDRKTCKDGGCANCLENYIGEDVMSRLHEGGKMARFTGKDYRKEAGE